MGPISAALRVPSGVLYPTGKPDWSTSPSVGDVSNPNAPSSSPAAPAPETVLVRISGPDRPGILAGVLDLMTTAESEIQDIEQITIRGNLDLNLVVSLASGRDLLKELLMFGWENDIDITFDVVPADHTPIRPRIIVTALARTIGPAQLHPITSAIASVGGNIERIVRLSREPVHSYELLISGADDRLDDLRSALIIVSRAHGVDVAVQREGLGRRAARLVVMDVDSTLIQDEVIDLLAEEAGCEPQVAAITRSAMAGELDFEQSLRARVKLLKGLPESSFECVRGKVRLTPGARTFVRTLRRLGYTTAIVSGGFTHITDHLRADLGLDYAYANQLEVIDGVLTGEVIGRVVDRAGKAELLRAIAEKEGIPLDQTVAIGDGANDLDMLAAAGLGVAFNAKPSVQERAQTTINVPYLDAVLFLLGIRREEVVDE
jgi:phosphoserine phosphatase